jgi:hypothetical protein
MACNHWQTYKDQGKLTLLCPSVITKRFSSRNIFFLSPKLREKSKYRDFWDHKQRYLLFSRDLERGREEKCVEEEN